MASDRNARSAPPDLARPLGAALAGYTLTGERAGRDGLLALMRRRLPAAEVERALLVERARVEGAGRG